jgi:hypothetical protein
MIDCAEYAYRSRDFEVKEEHTSKTAQYDGDGCGEILRNVVRIVDDQSNDDTTHRLEKNGSPYNPVVASKESSLCNDLAILPNDTKEQRGEERPER